MNIIFIGKAKDVSQYLAQLQSDLRGVIPSGPEIIPITSERGWDGRKS